MLRFASVLRKKRGFTLIELLIVMTIVAILAAIAVPSYKRSQLRARETVLMEDLYQMRSAVDAFFADRNRYPESLDELVSEHYIRGIPRDPMTLSDETWTVDPPLPTLEGSLAEGGVFDVHSGSDLIGLNNKPYNEW
jgi:general secretion pathway protein G